MGRVVIVTIGDPSSSSAAGVAPEADALPPTAADVLEGLRAGSRN